LDDEALQARGHYLHAEAAQLAIPQETLPNLDPNLRRFRSLQGVHGTLGELFSSHISYLPEVCLEWGIIPLYEAHSKHLKASRGVGLGYGRRAGLIITI